MAQKVLVQLVDDLDGSEASQTVRFGLDGVSYEIDLTDSHAEELRSAVDKFERAARRIGGARPKPRQVAGKAAKGKVTAPEGKASSPTKVTADNTTIRAWARSNGYTLGDKGRIAASIVEAFSAANP